MNRQEDPATEEKELRARLARHAKLTGRAETVIETLANVAPEFHRKFGPHYALNQEDLEWWFPFGSLVVARNVDIDLPAFPEFSQGRFVVGYVTGGRAYPGNIATPEIAPTGRAVATVKELYGSLSVTHLRDVEFLSLGTFDITLRRGCVVRASFHED